MIQIICLFFISLQLVDSSSTSEIHELWNKYKTTYNKTYYSPIEENSHQLIWEKNLKLVAMHNLKATMNNYSFKLGINHLSDKNPKEYRNLTGLKVKDSHKERNVTLLQDPLFIQIPAFVDWRQKGLVSKVQNQGECGACWAFATAGTIEGQYARKTGQLVPLSAQNLIDCTRPLGNSGCYGGDIDASFEYVKDNHGIDTDASYPYIEQENVCRFNNRYVGATIRGWVDIPSGDEVSLMQAIASVGPVAAGINALCYGFKEYASGVYDYKYCDKDTLNHGVLIVGYGTTNTGLDYWIVKNSWGRTWGEDGYIRISRNNNQCGVASLASYPIV